MITVYDSFLVLPVCIKYILIIGCVCNSINLFLCVCVKVTPIVVRPNLYTRCHCWSTKLYTPHVMKCAAELGSEEAKKLYENSILICTLLCCLVP